MVAPAVLQLAEHLNTYAPPRAGDQCFTEDPRFVLFLAACSGAEVDPHFTVVQRLRLQPSELPAVVAQVRAQLRAQHVGLVRGVRRRALELVAALRGDGPAASIAIVPLLDDPDPTVVEVAAWAAGERDPAEPGAVARLAELAVEADDALVREAAVAALGSLGDPAGLPAILAGTKDKATVRRRAVIALAPFDGPEVDAALDAAQTDRDWQVRQAAEDLTGH